MIILLGPDNSGKSTLAQQLVVRSAGTSMAHTSWKAVAATSYKDYIEFLRGPKSNPLKIETYHPGLALNMDGRVVCDRFFYCELPYSRLFRKVQRTQFTLKQWHNMHLSTIAFNPLVVLTNRRAEEGHADIVPSELFTPILEEYRYWLGLHGINYVEYDYETADAGGVLDYAEHNLSKAEWWLAMAKEGVAGVGNTVSPKVIVMAQDLGPSNIHRIAFEQGPSGYYLSDLIDAAEIPLNSFYLTNWLKTTDKGENVEYLRTEMAHLSQERGRGVQLQVVLLGREAEQTIPILRDYVLPEAIHTVRHPGWVVNHSYTIKEKKQREERYLEEWKTLWKTILTSAS